MDINIEQKEFAQNRVIQLEKANSELLQEVSRMRDRMKELRMKFRFFDNKNKICKRCGKEYLEAENYNWSCRRHTSEWGGDIYWCCGSND